jgi:regulator of replication initiation timing
MTDDDRLLEVMRETFLQIENESLARQRLAAGKPAELAATPTSIQEYVGALHTEVSRLQIELERLRADYEELETAKDTNWYIENDSADIATFGEESEAVNWDGLFKERQRLHELERILRDAQAIESAIERRDFDDLAASVDRLLRQIRE